MGSSYNLGPEDGSMMTVILTALASLKVLDPSCKEEKKKQQKTLIFQESKRFILWVESNNVVHLHKAILS